MCFSSSRNSYIHYVFENVGLMIDNSQEEKIIHIHYIINNQQLYVLENCTITYSNYRLYNTEFIQIFIIYVYVVE